MDSLQDGSATLEKAKQVAEQREVMSLSDISNRTIREAQRDETKYHAIVSQRRTYLRDFLLGFRCLAECRERPSDLLSMEIRPVAERSGDEDRNSKHPKTKVSKPQWDREDADRAPVERSVAAGRGRGRGVRKTSRDREELDSAPVDNVASGVAADGNFGRGQRIRDQPAKDRSAKPVSEKAPPGEGARMKADKDARSDLDNWREVSKKGREEDGDSKLKSLAKSRSDRDQAGHNSANKDRQNRKERTDARPPRQKREDMWDWKGGDAFLPPDKLINFMRELDRGVSTEDAAASAGVSISEEVPKEKMEVSPPRNAGASSTTQSVANVEPTKMVSIAVASNVVNMSSQIKPVTLFNSESSGGIDLLFGKYADAEQPVTSTLPLTNDRNRSRGGRWFKLEEDGEEDPAPQKTSNASFTQPQPHSDVPAQTSSTAAVPSFVASIVSSKDSAPLHEDMPSSRDRIWSDSQFPSLASSTPPPSSGNAFSVISSVWGQNNVKAAPSSVLRSSPSIESTFEPLSKSKSHSKSSSNVPTTTAPPAAPAAVSAAAPVEGVKVSLDAMFKFFEGVNVPAIPSSDTLPPSPAHTHTFPPAVTDLRPTGYPVAPSIPSFAVLPPRDPFYKGYYPLSNQVPPPPPPSAGATGWRSFAPPPPPPQHVLAAHAVRGVPPYVQPGYHAPQRAAQPPPPSVKPPDVNMAEPNIMDFFRKSDKLTQVTVDQPPIQNTIPSQSLLGVAGPTGNAWNHNGPSSANLQHRNPKPHNTKSVAAEPLSKWFNLHGAEGLPPPSSLPSSSVLSVDEIERKLQHGISP